VKDSPLPLLCVQPHLPSFLCPRPSSPSPCLGKKLVVIGSRLFHCSQNFFFPLVFSLDWLQLGSDLSALEVKGQIRCLNFVICPIALPVEAVPVDCLDAHVSTLLPPQPPKILGLSPPSGKGRDFDSPPFSEAVPSHPPLFLLFGRSPPRGPLARVFFLLSLCLVLHTIFLNSFPSSPFRRLFLPTPVFLR